ncbi:MAG: DUF4105 domain-containing protein [Archangium sp.]|nr:DUF4105 domain-containing protein [Archangium sp.]MDP3575952.1 DUF4105 domain-containing protein [Archangium sp.]
MLTLIACLLTATPLERLDAAGLVVQGPFTEVELTALAAGLDALPAQLRHAPKGRLRLVLDESLPATASGIAEPEWRGTDFVLTRQKGHVTFRDGSLDDDARRTLWRSRAVVHALLSAWDDVSGWSQTPRWRRINGWLLPLERPLSFSEHSLNQASTAFSRPRGKVSAKLDLLTFAETALVPVEKLPTDDLIRCQDFSRSRALGAFLGTGWEPKPCPAFDQWTRLDELEHIEVLLVQASGRAPESLFGHLLVRPVWRTSLGPSFDTAIQFAAITLPNLGPAHIAKGLFGGYSLGVFTISMTDLTREKLSGEQRSMTRWKLSLTPDEQRRFLERTWEFERRGRFTYAFFSDNCASVLVWMLETSLDEPTLAKWPGFITSPGGVLDDLFRAKKKTGERLLQAVFPTFESTGTVARRDEARRFELEKNFTALKADFSGAHDSEVATRHAAYLELARVSRQAPAALHQDLFSWWALSARVERASADEALHSLRELEQERVEPGTADLETLWSERLTSLERESTLQASLMLLDRETFMDDLRRRAKKRDATPPEAAQQQELEARLALFDEVTVQQGALVSEVFGEVSAAAFLEAEADAVIAEEITPAVRSLPLSGHWRTSLGGGLWRRNDGSTTPVVRLDEAGLMELLGEQRQRGIGAPVGVRMLEGSVTLAPSLRVPEVVQSHFTLVAFDSIALPVPPYPRWKEHLGFGFEFASDFRAWRSQHTLSGGAGWLLLGVHGDHARHLLTAGVGPALWVAVDPTGIMPVAGVTTRVVARVGLQLEWPSALRLEARHQSVWGPGRQLHEVRAELALEWVLAWGGRPRLLIRPTAALSAEPTLNKFDAMGMVMLEPVESLADLH